MITATTTVHMALAQWMKYNVGPFDDRMDTTTPANMFYLYEKSTFKKQMRQTKTFQ